MKTHTITSHTRRRAFTLIELIAVMTIVGAIAGVVAPLMVGASDNFAIATRQRAAADRMDIALMRITRSLRDASGAGGSGLVIAGDSRAVFGDGRRIELLGSTVWMAEPGGSAAPLCQSVEDLRFWYLSADGESDARSAPQDARRIRIRMRSGGMELCTTVHLAQTEVDS